MLVDLGQVWAWFELQRWAYWVDYGVYAELSGRLTENVKKLKTLPRTPRNCIATSHLHAKSSRNHQRRSLRNNGKRLSRGNCGVYVAIMGCMWLLQVWQPSIKRHVDPVTVTSSHDPFHFHNIVWRGSYGTAFREGVTAALSTWNQKRDKKNWPRLWI